MADAENRSKILEAEQNGEWESYISLHPRAQRIHALAKCEYLIEDNARFWELLSDCWVTNDWFYQNGRDLESLLGCGPGRGRELYDPAGTGGVRPVA